MIALGNCGNQNLWTGTGDQVAIPPTAAVEKRLSGPQHSAVDLARLLCSL
jgi:hypothetical protein